MAVRVGFGGGVESWSGLGGDDCIGDGWWGGEVRGGWGAVRGRDSKPSVSLSALASSPTQSKNSGEFLMEHWVWQLMSWQFMI